MTDPTTPTATVNDLLNLINQTRDRTLEDFERRYARNGIRALEAARAGTGHLRYNLHHADTDATRYAAALRRIDELVQAWQHQPPRAAHTLTAIEAIRDILTRTNLQAATPALQEQP